MTAMKYPKDMDAECIQICDALNALPGIKTIESCCGHGEHPHMIFFTAGHVKNLRPIVEAANSSAWSVEVGFANGSNSVYFFLRGPVGPATMPGGALDFASWISSH